MIGYVVGFESWWFRLFDFISSYRIIDLAAADTSSPSCLNLWVGQLVSRVDSFTYISMPLGFGCMHSIMAYVSLIVCSACSTVYKTRE